MTKDPRETGAPQTEGTQHAKADIWAIGGCKGGVGKSLITSSLGIMLSKRRKRVLLVDADLGAANLHTFIETEKKRSTISGFLKGEIKDIRSVVSRTSVPYLQILSGAKDSLDVANLNGNKIKMLQEALKKLDCDYILLDIGPGTSNNMLDLFLMAKEGILITTPEPTSIENTYRFLKCLLLRRIKNILNSDQHGRLKVQLQKVLYNRNGLRPLTIAAMLKELRTLDRVQGQTLRALMGEKSISIVINQTKRPEDKILGQSIERACYDYFGIEIGGLGSISYDDCVGDSIRYRKPLCIDYKHSEPARDIQAFVCLMLEKEGKIFKIR